MYRLLILILACAPLAAQAQVYRTTDEQGNVIFTDTPPAGSSQSERIEIRETNTAPPPPSRPAPPPAAAEEEEEEAIPQKVSIVKPIDETSFPMGPGNFSVEAQVVPGLGENQSLLLMLDGAPHGEPQRETTWDLTNVFRGAHDLTVAIVDANGDALISSEPIRVFVHRPSVNFKNRN